MSLHSFCDQIKMRAKKRLLKGKNFQKKKQTVRLAKKMQSENLDMKNFTTVGRQLELCKLLVTVSFEK